MEEKVSRLCSHFVNSLQVRFGASAQRKGSGNTRGSHIHPARVPWGVLGEDTLSTSPESCISWQGRMAWNKDSVTWQCQVLVTQCGWYQARAPSSEPLCLGEAPSAGRLDGSILLPSLIRRVWGWTSWIGPSCAPHAGTDPRVYSTPCLPWLRL